MKQWYKFTLVFLVFLFATPAYSQADNHDVSLKDFTELGFDHIVNLQWHNSHRYSRLARFYEKMVQFEVRQMRKSGKSAFEIERYKKQYLPYTETLKNMPFGHRALPNILEPVVAVTSDSDYDFDREEFTVCYDMGNQSLWRNDMGEVEATVKIPHELNGIVFLPNAYVEFSKRKCFKHSVPLNSAENFLSKGEALPKGKRKFKGNVSLKPVQISVSTRNDYSPYMSIYFEPVELIISD